MQIHRPYENPIRLYENRIELLNEQVGDAGEYSDLTIDLGVLQEKGGSFREGAITAEDLCRTIIHTFFSRREDIADDAARRNLQTLGHDFAAVANVDPEAFKIIWESEENRAVDY